MDKALYKDLVDLVKTNEAFYSKDYIFEDKTYRVFSYRLASYSDFCLPGAIECRGVMYEVKGDDIVRVASRPMHKFFNRNENPFTMGLDCESENVSIVMTKDDGSLISTFIHNGELYTKSKTSLFSEQAVAANKFIRREENKKFYSELKELTANDYTVNMEYVSPNNRIVLGYMKEQLIVLNIRHNKTGEYLFVKDIISHENFKCVQERWVKMDHDVGDAKRFIDGIPNMCGIEGFVIVLKDGIWFKQKTDWYMALHHTKDSITVPRRLFEAVINEATDDLKAMFFEDPVSLMKINEMEQKVIPLYDNMVVSVEKFYDENKKLDRKDYALKGQAIKDGLFGLKMEKYIGREVDYKQFAIKHPEIFGISKETACIED